MPSALHESVLELLRQTLPSRRSCCATFCTSSFRSSPRRVLSTRRSRASCPPSIGHARGGCRPLASKRIQFGGGESWAPLVVGPEGIPNITDAEHALRAPPLAMLSVMAHGREDNERALAEAVLDVLKTRGLPVSEEQRELIPCCEDAERLKVMLRRAVVVAATDETFA